MVSARLQYNNNLQSSTFKRSMERISIWSIMSINAKIFKTFLVDAQAPTFHNTNVN